MARKKSKSQSLKSKITKKKSSTTRSTRSIPRKAFQYSIDMTVDAVGKQFKIDQQFVKYIVFDYDYENYQMPVIYVGFSATTDLYNSITSFEAQKSGKIFFNLSCKDAYSNTALSHKAVTGQFSFIPSTDNLNYTEILDNATSADNSYRTMTIALISEELTNRSKTYINRIFTETSTNNLLAIALEGLSDVSTMIYN